MSNLSDIVTTQNRLEESIAKRLDDLQAQISNAGSSKDSVAKVAEELRNFRELIFGILSLLRKQISECAKKIDDLETRNRRKVIIVTGVPEKDKEDCSQVILDMINNKMGINNLSKSSIKVCHRLGTPSDQRQRPILVRFISVDVISTEWKAKTKLRGSSMTLKEFLTQTRQAVFSKSCLHFGMLSVWTYNGVIVIKAPCGSSHRITTEEELITLMAKYPKSLEKSSSKNINSGNS